MKITDGILPGQVSSLCVRWGFVVIASLLLSVMQTPAIFAADSEMTGMWVDSKNLTKWYNEFDLCMIRSTSNSSIDVIMKGCEASISPQHKQLPMRCRAGNSWPSKSEYCSASDIPFSERKNFQHSLQGLDDPTRNYLKSFFAKLAAEKGALIVIGDSVMQQFFSAIACELEREQVWKDPGKFTNTDEVQYVRVGAESRIVPMLFLPIYHFVNGRFDGVPMAAMRKLESTLNSYIEKHSSLVVMANMGLHYIDNPVPNFSRVDYQQQMAMALSYLHNFALSHTATKNVRIFWRETSAQHFPTMNGYWPGARYANVMKLTCTPLQDASAAADWRNRDIERILSTKKLFMVQVIPFYNISAPLWSMHPSGHMQDCTHFCW